MQTQQTSKEYFTTLSILHAALLIGQLIMMGVVYFLVQTNGGLAATGTEADDDFFFILQAIATVLVIGGVIVSQLIGKARLKTIKNQASLSGKLKDYRAIMILKLALLEAPAMTALVFYLISGKIYFLLLVFPIILIFFSERPSKFKVISDLELKKEDREKINMSDEIIVDFS